MRELCPEADCFVPRHGGVLATMQKGGGDRTDKKRMSHRVPPITEWLH